MITSPHISFMLSNSLLYILKRTLCCSESYLINTHSILSVAVELLKLPYMLRKFQKTRFPRISNKKTQYRKLASVLSLFYKFLFHNWVCFGALLDITNSFLRFFIIKSCRLLFFLTDFNILYPHLLIEWDIFPTLHHHSHILSITVYHFLLLMIPKIQSNFQRFSVNIIKNGLFSQPIFLFNFFP